MLNLVFQCFQLGLVLRIRFLGLSCLAALVIVHKERRNLPLHFIMAHRARARQHRKAVGSDDLTDVLHPEAHGDFLPVLGAQFRGFQEDHHQAVEGIDLIFRQVVLGDYYIPLANPPAFPGKQAKVGIGGIRSRQTISAAVCFVTAYNRQFCTAAKNCPVARSVLS